MERIHKSDCPCHDDVDAQRRRLLKLSAALGVGLVVPTSNASQNVHELNGVAFVNRQRITQATVINPGDTVTVGHDSNLTFSIGQDVYRLRSNTSMQVEADSNLIVTGLRLFTGALLGVFGHGQKTIHTRTATIGIRGTGLYLDSAPDKTYFCTCYGETEVRVPNMQSQVYAAEHHNAIMIYTPANKAPYIHNMAGFEGHTDDELRRNESYVGRTVPFDS